MDEDFMYDQDDDYGLVSWNSVLASYSPQSICSN